MLPLDHEFVGFVGWPMLFSYFSLCFGWCKGAGSLDDKAAETITSRIFGCQFVKRKQPFTKS